MTKYNHTARKIRRKKYFQEGFCRDCPRQRSPNSAFCSKCKNKHKKPQQVRQYRHGFTIQDERRFQNITHCDWCHNPFVDETPRIDHDHRCCGSRVKHCSNCTRGFVHENCNRLGIAYFEWLEAQFGITDPKLTDYRQHFPVPR